MSRSYVLPNVPALLALVLGLAQLTLANDTMVTLGAGGLVPVKSSKIVMESEKLYISVHRVKVDYVFRNTSKQDVNAEVAFPLPELDGATLENSPIQLPSKSSVNFMFFKVIVDGALISPKIEIRAVKDGKDITDKLRSLGLPVSVLDPGMKRAIEKLPPGQRNQLEKDELIVSEETSGGGKTEKWVWPWWQTRVQFHWTQHFASNSIVRVSHSYQPIVGGSYIVYDDDGSSTANRYCGAASALKQIKDVKAKLAKKGGTGVTLWERNIKYILTTANNWSGPIRTFHLEINSDSPDDIVLACMPSVKQVSPTHYEMNALNFRPDRELDLMILQANR
jgi:hypothetical protein